MKKIVVLIFSIIILFLYSCSGDKIVLTGIKEFEEMQYMTSGPIELKEDYFEGYFILHDYENNRIPLILHLSMNIIQDERLSANNNIVNVSTTIIGQNETKIYDNIQSEYENYSKILPTYSDDISMEVSREYEGAVAYIQDNFVNSIEIIGIDESSIEYKSKPLDANIITIRVIRDSISEKLYLEVEDNADAKSSES